MATDEQIAIEKQIILLELSEHDATSTLIAPNIDALWASMAARSGGDYELQAMLVRRRAIDILIGANWRTGQAHMNSSSSNSSRSNMADPVSVLRMMRETVQAEIETHAVIGRFNIDIYEPDENEF